MAVLIEGSEAETFAQAAKGLINIPYEVTSNAYVFIYGVATDEEETPAAAPSKFRALVRPLGIQPNRVIGMDVQLCTSNQGEMNALDYTMDKNEQIIQTGKLLLKNLKTNKVLQIMQEIGKKPVLTFGNSGGDCAMHNLCLSNGYHSAAFMLVADDEARDFANREKAL